MIFPRDRTRLGFVASPAAEPPSAPLAPILTLLPASDLGSTSGDHLSNDPFPQMAADFDDAAQAGETVRVYLDAGDTAGATLHDSFVLTSEMLSGGAVPAGTFDAIPAGAWMITMTHVNAGGESPHSNAVPYTMNQSLGPVALSVGVGNQTSDTTPDVVLDLSGATVLAGDHAAVIAADGTVLGTADLTTATLASCPVTLSALALGAHTVRGYVWRDDGTFTELQSYAFTVNAALAISGTPVLTATEDTAYAGFTASATGGVTPYVFSLQGTWPAGISIDSGTGVVSGTPTESGSFASLSVRVTDDEGSTDDLATFTLEVAAAGYVANAVNFTGSQHIAYGDVSASLADAAVGTFSIWLRLPTWPSSGIYGIFDISTTTNNRFVIYVNNTSGVVGIFARDASNVTKISATVSSCPVDTWFNLQLSWNTAAGISVYVNDADYSANLTTNTLASGNIDYTMASLFVGCDNSATNKLVAYVAELWFDPTARMDITVEANRRKFIDAAGKPVDLLTDGSGPTGAQVKFCHNKAAASWHTNAGSVSGGTLTGTLSAAPNSPSD